MAQTCTHCCWSGIVTLETPGLMFHGAPGPWDEFLKVSEHEMCWETPPSSNNPTREGLPRRRSCTMPEQHMGRSNLTSILIDTYASGSSLSTPSNLTPPLSSFSTPTLLHTHNSFSLYAAWLCWQARATLFTLASKPRKKSLVQAPTFGVQSKQNTRSPFLLPLHRRFMPGDIALHRYPISGGLHGCAKAAPAALSYSVTRMLHSKKRGCSKRQV